MADLDRLQTLTADISPPQFDDLVETARRRDRRRVSGVLVVAALVAVGLTLGALRGPGDDKPAPAPTPDRSQPQRIDELVGVDVLPPGEYAIPFIGAPETPRAVVTIPDGFQARPSEGGQFILWARGHRDIALLDLWTVARMPTDPCFGRPDKFMTPRPGVHALAEAFARQRNSVVTKPVPVRVDGYAGVYVESSMPKRVDPKGCYGGGYVQWASPQGTATARHAGLISGLWILDVEGQRLLIAGAHTPNARPDAVSAIDGIVESIDLQPDSQAD